MDCVIIYELNYGFGVVRPEMAMDFGSTLFGERAVRARMWMWDS